MSAIIDIYFRLEDSAIDKGYLIELHQDHSQPLEMFQFRGKFLHITWFSAVKRRAPFWAVCSFQSLLPKKKKKRLSFLFPASTLKTVLIPVTSLTHFLWWRRKKSRQHKPPSFKKIISTICIYILTPLHDQDVRTFLAKFSRFEFWVFPSPRPVAILRLKSPVRPTICSSLVEE